MSDSSQPQGLQPSRLLHPWDFPGKSTGVECHHLLREVMNRFEESELVNSVPEELWTEVCNTVQKAVAPDSSTLAWRIPGTGSLVGCHLWGRTESAMTEAT